ncbi:hypothetical protein C9374_012226 [Naegleria lovaniensis]|uniref:Tandem-95 repeat protein n=1 Tax=Naegleria lovaniensis TaxID=51637 RepID=A0AA88GDD6_NAELO|nr:uncharacterized protein C9374_012226 [Naegleria lovaniensis]KAG2373360.1 hypothetical protein C9374_012226 [Naegleria lovaniensis]
MVTVGAGYEPPKLKPDHLQAFKHVSYIITPLLNDVDPKANNLTLVNITQPLYGTTKLIGGNRVQYISNKYYAGNDSFEYTVSNGYAYASSVVTIEVLNRPPEPIPISIQVSKNSKNNIIDLFNYVSDSGARINDIDDDILTIVGVGNTTVKNAQVNIVDALYLTYTPPAGFNDIDSFEYTITDRNTTVSQTITVEVINDAPVATPDDITVPKNKVSSLDLLSNDYDINNDHIFILGNMSGSGSKGTVVFSDDGLKAQYYPPGDTHVFIDSFEYTITDGSKMSSTYVFVRVKNTPPFSPDQTITIPKNSLNNNIPLDYQEKDMLDTVTMTLIQKPVKGTFQLQQLSSINPVNYLGQHWVNVPTNSYNLIYSPQSGMVYTEVVKIKVDDGYDSMIATLTLNVVNTPPVTVNDTIVCEKNKQVTLNVVENDYDLNGDTILLSTDPSDWVLSENNATVSRVDNNVLQYTAKSGFLGNDVATYVVTDSNSDGSNVGVLKATGYVHVQVVNTPPVASDKTFTVPKGVVSTLDALQGDYDPNSDPVDFNSTTAVIVTPAGVSVSVNTTSQPRNMLNYPALDAVYQDKFTYTIRDVDGATASAIVTVHVVNTAPVAFDDSATTKWNRSVVIHVLTNDYDQNPAIDPNYSDLESNAATVVVTVENNAPTTSNVVATTHWRDTSVIVPVLETSSDVDSDPLHIESVTQPPKGSVSIVKLGDGSDALKYQISASQAFVGEETMTFVVSDYSKTASATLKVTVTNTNPVAQDDAVTLHWSTPSLTIPVLSNDRDDNNDPFYIKDLNLPTPFYGSCVKTESDSKLLFTPTAQSKGYQVITYTITDGQGVSAPANVGINVTNANKPSDLTISKTVHWSTQTVGTKITLFSQARDADGDLLSIDLANSPVQAPSSGALNMSNGDSNNLPYVTYQQQAGFKGNDVFKVKVTDGADTAVYTVNMNVYNNAPVLTAASTSGHFNVFASGFTVDAIQLTKASDLDPEDTLSLVSITPSQYVTRNGNQITFLPVAPFTGTKVYTIGISDGLETTTTTWTVTVQNVAPVAAVFPTTIHWSKGSEVIDVLASITDADVDAVNITSVSSASSIYGSPSIIVAGKQFIKWTLPSPTVSMLGSTSFTVQFTDGWATGSAIYAVTVQNNAPTAKDISVSLHWSRYATGVLINPMTDASDLDSQDTITFASTPFSAPSHGTVELSGSDKLLYKPTATYVGSDSFTFTLTDGLQSVTKTVTVAVNNQLPVCSADSISIHWNTSYVDISVLGNDSDPDTEDSPKVKIGSLSTPTQGSVSLQSDTLGIIRYTPATIPTLTLGTKTFTYKVTDGAQDSLNSALVSVQITNAHQPSAPVLSNSIHWREALNGITYSPYSAVTDADGDSLTLSLGSTNDGNSYSIEGASGTVQSIKFIKNTPYKGIQTCTYSLSDGFSTASSSITTTVTNDVPTAQDINLNYHWSLIGTGLTINIIQYSTDNNLADIAFLKVNSVSASNRYGDCVSISSDATSVLYKPSNLVAGEDYFTYTITDGLDVSIAYKVTVNITSTTANPSDQFYNVHWRAYATPVVFPVLQNISSGGDVLNIDSISQNPNQGGSALITDSQTTITYSPLQGFIGTETFVVRYRLGLSYSLITVTVNVYDNAPTGTSKTATTHWRTPVSINLMANATDVDSADVPFLTATSATSPSKGSVGSITSGFITYTPETTVGAFIGTATFNYKIYDEKLYSSYVPVSVIVTNSAPVSGSKSMNVLWSDFVNGKEISVLTLSPADSDPNGDPIRVKSFGSISRGTVVAKTGNTNIAVVKGVSGEKYLGPVTFSYVVTDDASNGDVTSSVNLNIYNNKPVANPDSITTHWNLAYVDIDVLANDNDPDSNTLSITNVYGSSATTAPTITGGKIRYYPRTASVGSVDTFKYELSDGVQTSEGTVTVNVTNTKPTTQSYSQSVVWSVAKNGLTFNVVQNSADANGDALSLVGYTSITSDQGTLSTVGSGSTAQIRFVPTSGFTGPVTQIVFTITDQRATVTGTIDITVLNNPPVINTAAFTYHWRQALQTNTINLATRYSDADSDFVNTTQVTSAGKGNVYLSAVNTVTYKLSSAWKGSDSFSVLVTDGWTTKSATFPVTVTNNVPVAYDITVNVQHTAASSINIPILTRSDSLKPTDADSADSSLLTVSSYTSPAVGTLTYSAGAFTYQNPQGNLQTKTFTYTISDGFETVTKTITINILDQAPTANAVSKTSHWRLVQNGWDLNFITESGASDADGDTLTISAFTQPQSGAGTVARKAASLTNLIYTPPAGVAPLTANFKFTVSDGSLSVEKNCQITLTNTAPVANADVLIKSWKQTTFTITPLTNDNDANSDPITISSVDSVSRNRGAALTVSADKTSITYTYAGSGATGNDTISYTITDGAATSTSTITIVFTNTEPVVTSFNKVIKWNSNFVENSLLSRCSDADGDTVTFSGVVQGTLGTTVVNDASVGKITYTPNLAITYTNKPVGSRWEAYDTVTFKCTDGLAEKSGTISVTIWNTPPQGSDKNGSFNRQYSNPVVLIPFSTLLTGASDADSDSLTISSVQMYAGSDSSSSVMIESGNVKFTYGQQFIGTQKFYFSISDGQLSTTYTYTITIVNSFTCMDYTITTTKDSAATQFEDSIKAAWAAQFGTEPITITISNTATLNSVGDISTVNTKLTYTPNARRSCTGNACYASFVVKNQAAQSATCKLFVNQPNKSPVASNWEYEFSIRRDGNDVRTFDYIKDSGAQDPDIQDSLSIAIADPGTCASAATSLSIVSNKISFTRANSYIDQRCTLTLTVTDNDLSSPSSVSVTVGIKAISSPPIAVNDEFSTKYNTFIDVTASSLLLNDYDPLGGTFEFVNIYCPDSTIIGSCEAEKIQYKIKSLQDGTTATADVAIKYTDCVCSKIFDLIFVLDGSGSISDTNWKNMRYFVNNITAGFNVGSDATRIGIVQYGSTSTLHLSVASGTSKTTVTNTMNSIAQLRTGTATIKGINTGIDNMVSAGRASVTDKLFIHITDGESNYPCSCSDCVAQYGSSATCVSPRFPAMDCGDCDWQNATSKCQPCAEATIRSSEINSWKAGNPNNPESSKTWNYRQLAIGIGAGVTSNFGMMQIQKMNYDPLKFFLVDWTDLTNVYSKVIDEACNTIPSSATYQKRPISDFDYTITSSRSVTTRRVFDVDYSSTKFTYSITVPSSSSMGAVKRFAVANSIDSFSYTSYSPSFPVYLGKDIISGLSGFIWESLPNSNIVPTGTTKSFALSVCGNIAATNVNFTVAGASTYAVSQIQGPISSSCTYFPPAAEDATKRVTSCTSSRCLLRTQFTDFLNYDQVVAICKLWNPNGTPVTIKSATEKTEVMSVASGFDFFIGLYKSGSSWKWIDGSSVSYTDWKSGNPNNNSPTDYNDFNAISAGSSSGQWDDAPAIYKYKTVVCQYKL